MTLSTFAFAEDTQEKSHNLINNIQSINYDILDLEVSYQLDESGVDFYNEVADINNELLYHEYQLGTPTDDNSNWGQLRFRVIDFKGEEPGQVKLRYNYGF